MNSLSWFLYFADVLPSFAHLCGGISIVGFCFLGFFTLVMIVNDEGIPAGWKKTLQWGIPVGTVLILVGTLIPEKNTLYAIAASEMGEKVVESKLGQKAQQALEAWIDNQLPKKEAK